MWQTIQAKAEGIEQFRRGDSFVRTIDDIAGEAANAAEMKAAATGNELIFTQVKLSADLKKMEAIYSNFQRSQHTLEKRIANLEKAPEITKAEIEEWQSEIMYRDKNKAEVNYFAANGQIYGDKHHEALLKEVVNCMREAASSHQEQKVGLYRGYQISVQYSPLSGTSQFILRGESKKPYWPGNLSYGPDDKLNAHGFIQRLDNFFDRFETFIEDAEKRGRQQAEALVVARQSQVKEFPQMEMLESLRRDNREVMVELCRMQADPGYKSEWVPSSKLLMEKRPANDRPEPEKEPSEKDRSKPARDDDRIVFVHVGDKGTTVMNKNNGPSR